MREVVQRTWQALTQARGQQGRRHLEAFLSRLHWHCHFIQRIEDEPEIAVRTMNGSFEGLRTENEEWFQRWAEGRTGYPAVDAAMRALQQTGWLHFRGRAMVVSFICNTLLLDWRQPAQILAQLFLDYEPGIHYSQVQMQAGTTGFNTIRIYNPVKQSQEHDEHGQFIRMFVPELRAVPTEYIHEPWKHLDLATIGYPPPIIDLTTANRQAREVLWGARATTRGDAKTRQLLERHGSRMSRASGRSRTGDGGKRSNVVKVEKNSPRASHSAPEAEQLAFEFDFPNE
jgi:deoxyribodipyrimidine photo-lyase